MKAPLPPDAQLERLARRIKGLAQPLRLAMLYQLRAGELASGELCRRLGRHQANVSRDLSLLTNRGIVRTRKSGNHVYYTLADPALDRLLALLESIYQTPAP